MELVAIAALGIVAICLGIADWKRRTVGLRVILACYVVAVCINSVFILTDILPRPDTDISRQASASTWLPSAGESAMERMEPATGSILTVLFLSGAMLAFYRLGLLASGDALAVPAILTIPVLVASPMQIILFFMSAMAFVLAIAIARNLCNNFRHMDRAYGCRWHRMYLMLFCYYGDGAACRWAFKYSGMIRRDYDSEPYYSGKEEMWLVPGLPLLSGFAPATLVLLVI